MNFKRTKVSASNNDSNFKTCGTIFAKTYTDISGMKSSYFVITPPHIPAKRRNGNNHRTIHPSSTNTIVVQKSTDVQNTAEKSMVSFQRTCNTDVKYLSTYLSYIMSPLICRSVYNPNISSVNLTEVQPTVSYSVPPSGTLNKYIPIQCMIQEHTDTLCIDNSHTSKTRKLIVLTPLHLTGSSAMLEGMLSSVRQGYKTDNMITYPTYHENRIRKYKSPVQVAFEKLRWLCNILRPTKYHRITVRDETDSQRTYFDAQSVILTQSITNACEDVSTYYVFYKYIYEPDTKIFLNVGQNVLSSMKVLAIQDSPDIQQPKVAITPYIREPNMTCNPMLNIGRNAYGTDKFSLLLYTVMKTTLEKQIRQTRRTIAEAKKALQELTHLSILNEENQQLIIHANEEPRIIYASTDMTETRPASSCNNTSCTQEKQRTEEKQGIHDKVHVTDENIYAGHVDIPPVTAESTPEKIPRIWSIFNRVYNMQTPGIFTSLKNILSPECILPSTKSSTNKIQSTRTKPTSVKKHTKHSAKGVTAPRIEYEWTSFYPTHGNINKKGGLSYLLHFKEIKKQVPGKPEYSRKYPVFKKPNSLPVENHRATISGSRPSYTSNHYFVVHFSNSENKLEAEDQNLPMLGSVNVPDKNKITKDSIFEEKSTTFFKTYQDFNLNALLRFQYYYRQ